MECILWNKKKTPDYKCTFLGEEPILFVGELFDNSNCLVTDANNDNKPVEDYEYGKIEHAIRGDEEIESISFVKIYQQKYATGKLDLSNYVYDNKNNCNVYYNGELLDPNTTNQVPFNSIEQIKPEQFEIVVMGLSPTAQPWVNYPIEGVQYEINNNHLIIKTKTGIYLGANGKEGYEIKPLEEVEIPVLLKTEDTYSENNYWNEVLPILSGNKISCTVVNSSGVSMTEMINADTYTITYSLTNENTIWTNGTTNPVQYKYIIKKAQVEMYCDEDTKFTLSPNTKIERYIRALWNKSSTYEEIIIEGLNIEHSLDKNILSVTIDKDKEDLDLAGKFITFTTKNFSQKSSGNVQINLDMTNFEGSLIFELTLEPFVWGKATWADLKELCKNGNLENNNELQNQIASNSLSKEFSVTESTYIDTNGDEFSIPAKTYTAILVNAYQKKMVFAISEPITEKIPWSQRYNAGYYYLGTTVNGYCDAFKEQMNIKQYLSIPVLKVWERDETIVTYPTSSAPSHGIFPFSAMELNLPDNTSSSGLIKRNDSIGDTNNMPLKNTSWYNEFSINSFWLRQFGISSISSDYWAYANKNNNTFSISSGKETIKIGLVVGFIIDGEEETANG